MKRIILLTCLFLLNVSLWGQSFFSPGAWKHFRKEFQFGLGASNFLGDLGGRDAIGTNFLRDWEISQTRYVARLSYGYYLGQNWLYRSQVCLGVVSGNDNTTMEPFRHNRNLNFRSQIIEFNQSISLFIMREKMGNKFGLKNVKGRKIGAKSNAIGIYLTAGVGVFYFNPMSKYQGANVVLWSLHTEGQGLPGGPKQYKRVSVDIPLGIGFRKALSRQWGVNLEFTQHYTFTDWIDDVSTVYYDNAALLANYGPVSAAMADPNLGNFVNPNGDSYVTAVGQQRGDPKDKDNYMFLTVGAYYKVNTRSSHYGRGPRKKKIKALF
ncbi:MAG TPA: hypothetical protein VD905_17660 [Flavobacteriales bacterium]|nr:hypothetical protein [Flavobacteriales bacterium]